MTLFGNLKTKEPKKRETLIDVSKRILGTDDLELINELNLYLKSRRQQHNAPSKVSWEMQMNLLKNYPQSKRISSVHTATMRGYRQVAFEDKAQPSRNTGTSNNYTIINEGF